MVAVSVALAWLSLGPPVQHPAGLPTRWAAPSECPDKAALRERVDALVPGLLDASALADAELQVEVEIQAGPDGYATRVWMLDDGGETRREFVARDCETAVDVSALILAVMLDPVATSVSVQTREPSEAEVSREPEQEQELTAEPEPEPTVEPEPAPPVRETAPIVEVERARMTSERVRLGFGLRVSGGGGYGSIAAAQATLAGGFALRGDRWRVELGGLWSIPRTARLDGGTGGGRFDAWAVFGRACFAPQVGRRDRIELPACGGIELGSVRGRGLEELPVTSRASFLWVAPALGQGVWFSPIERVGIGVELQLAVPLNRGSFAVDSIEVQRIAPVTVRALAGIELHW